MNIDLLSEINQLPLPQIYSQQSVENSTSQPVNVVAALPEVKNEQSYNLNTQQENRSIPVVRLEPGTTITIKLDSEQGVIT